MTLESKKSESVGTEARKNELTLVCKMGILFFFPSLVGNFILNKIHTTEELKSVLKLSFLHMMVTGIELYGVIDMIKFCISFYNKASISWGYKTTGAVMTGCLVNSINAMLIAMASGTRIKEETASALIGTATSWLCLCVLVSVKRHTCMNISWSKHKEKVEASELEETTGRAPRDIESTTHQEVNHNDPELGLEF